MPDKMNDPIAAYQEAIAALQEARRRAEEMATFIADVHRKLSTGSRWPAIAVTGQPGPWPKHHGSDNAHRTIDGSRWPDISQLASALSGYHAADAAAEAAYNAVPEAQRNVVSPPTNFTVRNAH
ncbi:MAG: hypothetical protein AB7O62_00145 [Pirellulales bacterium]